MSSEIPRVSLFDDLRINVCHALPYYLRGIFARHPMLYQCLSRLGCHPFSPRFGNQIRRKYGSNYVYANMLGRKTLLVFDNAAVQQILGRSPAVYAESSQKRAGMSHFQPQAATVSRGSEWESRRRFNDIVLESEQRIHSRAKDFVPKVQEVARRPHRQWKDFRDSFHSIMLQVMFGRDDPESRELSERQRTLMMRGNRLFGAPRSRLLNQFHASLRSFMQDPAARGLASLCPHAPQSVSTKPTHRMAHWMFAMRDSLAINTARALALLVTHSEHLAQVREELPVELGTQPDSIHDLTYLEWCIHEAMRLWPSTPLLVRETTQADRLRDRVIPPRTQVLISNNHHHRDTSAYPDADRFVPDRWRGVDVNYKFNHFSNGPQVCAGKNLAMLLAKSFLSEALRANHYRLLRPRIRTDEPIPYTYNHFKLRFECTAAREVTQRSYTEVVTQS